MDKHILTGLAALSLSVSPAALMAKAPPSPPSSLNVAPIVAKAPLAYERFTLANGLRVLVHTDRKAPVVAVAVYYDVGSKHEPKGKTGFAHLFEHLMFNGSENADGDWFEPMAQIGATDMNGQTMSDATRYYETVPVGALERTLFLESDRMGYLLGAVTQDKLDNQIGVVKNEKRQKIGNSPFGEEYELSLSALFGANNPYGHSGFGDMADLDAASLDDVRSWFRSHYGPNNAVVVLAGDIDTEKAKPLMERYFGPIPRGPRTEPVAVAINRLSSRTELKLKDKISATRIERKWAIPGLNDKDAIPLSIGATVLGGLASSRLDNALVRDEQLAVRVTAGTDLNSQLGAFEVTADVKPGVDPAIVERRLDQLIAELVHSGPTQAEINRVVAQETVSTMRGLETVGGKAATLADGEVYSNDPNKFAHDLAAKRSATPRTVQAALSRWLSRPALAVIVEPGERAPSTEASSAPIATGKAPASQLTRAARPDGTSLPALRDAADLDFPEVSHTKLSNGIQVVYAQRATTPFTRMSLSFEAGYSADPRDKLGTVLLTTALLKEGTTSLSSKAIAEREEELGISIGAGSSMDRTAVSLTSLSEGIQPALKLFSDILLHPAFNPADIERVRAQQLTRIQSELKDPGAIVSRLMGPALYGAQNEYGIPGTGSGTADSVKLISRDDLVNFHQAWLRPETAKLFIVSDKPLAELMPLLNGALGSWKGQGEPGRKQSAPPAKAQPRIILVDRPNSPQSQISAAQTLDVRQDGLVDLNSANDVLGGSFLSRINMDLREKKGWTYGVRAGVGQREHAITYSVSAPVQADKTGAAIKALIEDMGEFLTTNGVTPAELERTRNNNVRELPGSFQTASAVLGAMQENDLLGRPDDWFEQLPARYRSQSAAALDQAARQALQPAKLLWIVVGDAAKVKPQLEELGLPVEVTTPQ